MLLESRLVIIILLRFLLILYSICSFVRFCQVLLVKGTFLLCYLINANLRFYTGMHSAQAMLIWFSKHLRLIWFCKKPFIGICVFMGLCLFRFSMRLQLVQIGIGTMYRLVFIHIPFQLVFIHIPFQFDKSELFGLGYLTNLNHLIHRKEFSLN